MSISHTVWSLDEKKPLQVASLLDEKELELLLRDNIEILNKGWLVISNQVKTDAGKFIDILCIDHDGDMVVVELKKDLTPREVTAQVIDYAASVSKMTVEKIAQLYLSFTSGNETLNDAFLKKFGTALDEASVNQNVKMVIVAAKMDDGTERIIRFLTVTMDKYAVAYAEKRRNNRKAKEEAAVAEPVQEEQQPVAEETVNQESNPVEA